MHYQKPQSLALWYWLNPLVILEFTGNLHFEGLVIFFTLVGIYLFEKNKKWGSAVGFGLAIGTKLLPLIYLPFLFLKGLYEKKWLIAILSGVVGLLTLLPLLDETFISAMSESLDLYFRSFEFNASIYFVARAIGYWIYGYNNIALIGPLFNTFHHFYPYRFHNWILEKMVDSKNTAIHPNNLFALYYHRSSLVYYPANLIRNTCRLLVPCSLVLDDILNLFWILCRWL